MKKLRRIQISVPEPCTRGWQEMTPVAGGRYCASCDKTVTDFTAMTDRELFQFFKNGNFSCGHFHSSQLERLIATPAAQPRSNWIARIGLALSLLFAAGKKADAQQKSPARSGASRQPVYYSPSKAIDDDKYRCIVEISGQVHDELRRPVAGVRVIFSRQIATQTDANGRYLLKIPGDSLRVWSKITYKYQNYDEASYQFFPEDAMAEKLVVDITLKMPAPVVTLERIIDGGARLCYHYSDNRGIEYADPGVAAEDRFDDYKRTGTGFTPVVITLPSFKFIGRFFGGLFKTRKPRG